MSSIGTTCAWPPPAAPPFMPNTGPSEGSRRQIDAFLPMRFSASPRPTVVVVLPSPAGVGLIAVTRISLPSGRSSQTVDIVERDLGLVVPIGLEVLVIDAELVGGELRDALHLRALGDFNVRGHGFSSGNLKGQASTTFCGLPAAKASTLSIS